MRRRRLHMSAAPDPLLIVLFQFRFFRIAPEAAVAAHFVVFVDEPLRLPIQRAVAICVQATGAPSPKRLTRAPELFAPRALLKARRIGVAQRVIADVGVGVPRLRRARIGDQGGRA
jgi:hypothetical protein